MYSWLWRSDLGDSSIAMSPNTRLPIGLCNSYERRSPAINIISSCSMYDTKTCSTGLDEVVESWAIRLLRTPVHMPTSTAHCERLIGTIRRECLDYVIPLNASHLQRTLREWIRHYNSGRPHRSLGPGIPDQLQPVAPAGKRANHSGRASRVIAKPILGGLHHEYRWADAA